MEEEKKADFPENDGPNQSEDDHLSMEEYYLQSCRFGDYEDVVECLLNNVKVDYLDKNLNNALHMCCANGHLKILTLLIENLQSKDSSLLETLINNKNCDGDTPLHWATVNNRIECAEILINNKADCSIKNNFEKTALEESLNFGFDKMMVKSTNLKRLNFPKELLAKNTKPDMDEYKDLENEDYQINEINSDDEKDL